MGWRPHFITLLLLAVILTPWGKQGKYDLPFLHEGAEKRDEVSHFGGPATNWRQWSPTSIRGYRKQKTENSQTENRQTKSTFETLIPRSSILPISTASQTLLNLPMWSHQTDQKNGGKMFPTFMPTSEMNGTFSLQTSYLSYHTTLRHPHPPTYHSRSEPWLEQESIVAHPSYPLPHHNLPPLLPPPTTRSPIQTSPTLQPTEKGDERNTKRSGKTPNQTTKRSKNTKQLTTNTKTRTMNTHADDDFLLEDELGQGVNFFSESPTTTTTNTNPMDIREENKKRSYDTLDQEERGQDPQKRHANGNSGLSDQNEQLHPTPSPIETPMTSPRTPHQREEPTQYQSTSTTSSDPPRPNGFPRFVIPVVPPQSTPLPRFRNTDRFTSASQKATSLTNSAGPTGEAAAEREALQAQMKLYSQQLRETSDIGKQKQIKVKLVTLGTVDTNLQAAEANDPWDELPDTEGIMRIQSTIFAPATTLDATLVFLRLDFGKAMNEVSYTFDEGKTYFEGKKVSIHWDNEEQLERFCREAQRLQGKYGIPENKRTTISPDGRFPVCLRRPDDGPINCRNPGAIAEAIKRACGELPLRINAGRTEQHQEVTRLYVEVAAETAWNLLEERGVFLDGAEKPQSLLLAYRQGRRAIGNFYSVSYVTPVTSWPVPYSDRLFKLDILAACEPGDIEFAHLPKNYDGKPQMGGFVAWKREARYKGRSFGGTTKVLGRPRDPLKPNEVIVNFEARFICIPSRIERKYLAQSRDQNTIWPPQQN